MDRKEKETLGSLRMRFKFNADSAAEWGLALLRMAIGWHFLYEGIWKLMQEDGWSCLSYLEVARGPFAPIFNWMATQEWLVLFGDWFIQIGLVVIGISLITGIFARFAAIAGIALMAMFYCCQPPEPFTTAYSGADGRFFIIERNVIEAIALLFVAAIPCWRGALKTLLPGAVVLAIFSGCAYMQYRAGAFKKVVAVTSATVKVHEFTALAELKKPFDDKVKIAGVKVSSLILGGDLIAGNSHARDLIWTDEFMRRYNSGVSLDRLVRYCLYCGIDTVFAEPQFMDQMFKEGKRVGGELNFFANCENTKDASMAVSAGAKSVYLRPQTVDALAAKGDKAALKKLFADFKALGIPVGIGAENIDTVKFCAANGVTPAYWVIAYHSLNYPAAKIEKRCNNIWCVDPKAVADYMKTRKEPWVAIRCLAGGALKPVDAWQFSRDGGASASAIDLLDYRIVETVNGVMKKLEDAKKKGTKEVKK